MKRKFLSLFIVIGLFILINCGNEPPEDFYAGSTEDSTAVTDLLAANPDLLETEDMFVTDWVPVAFGAVEFFDEDQFYRNIDTIVKQLVDMVKFSDVEEMTRYTDLWFARDTTCTVTLYDTFALQCSLRYVERHTGYYFWQGDTGIELDTIIVDYDTAYDVLDLDCVGKRLIFFDVTRELVWVEEEQESVYAVVEPREWILKRISYGNYEFPQPGSSVPQIAQVELDDGVNTYTIVESSYDTLDTGHVMNRFRSIDSLLVFNDNDTLATEITVYNVVPGSLLVFMGSSGGGNRTEFTGLQSGTGFLAVNGAGTTNLYFEAVADEAFYYVVPRKDYAANVWLIPVDIGGAR